MDKTLKKLMEEIGLMEQDLLGIQKNIKELEEILDIKNLEEQKKQEKIQSIFEEKTKSFPENDLRTKNLREKIMRFKENSEKKLLGYHEEIALLEKQKIKIYENIAAKKKELVAFGHL